MHLRQLSRSAPIALVALTAMFNAACGLARVQPRMAKDFASGETKVKTVALLPVDVSVLTDDKDGSHSDPELEEQLIRRTRLGLTLALQRRGYKVTPAIGPHGCTATPERAIVIHPTDLAALRVEIHRSTAIQGPGPGFIEARVSADLTQQLQATTGADASLYARGYVHIARNESGGSAALKILGALLMVVLIVGVLAMVLSGGKGSKSKSKSTFKGRSRTRRSSRRVSSRSFRHSSRRHHRTSHRHRISTGRILLGAARAVAEVGEVALRTAPLALEAAAEEGPVPADVACHRCDPPPPPPGPVMEDGVDEPGAPPEALPAPPVHTKRAPEPPPTIMLGQPGKTPRGSTVGLAISLVHNQSGRVLWHASQDFPVKLDRSYNVEKLLDHFLEGLPRAKD